MRVARFALSVMAQTRPADVIPSVKAHGARFQARLDAARGRQEGVPAGFEAAAAVFRKAGMRFWEAVVQLEYAEWLIDQGRPQDAASPLSEARSIFEELKARPSLERLERAAAAMVSAGALAPT